MVSDVFISPDGYLSGIIPVIADGGEAEFAAGFSFFGLADACHEHFVLMHMDVPERALQLPVQSGQVEGHDAVDQISRLHKGHLPVNNVEG